MTMGQVKAGTRPPWLGLGAAVWLQSSAGTSSAFALYSPALKVALGADQSGVALLGVACNIGDSFGLLPGVVCNKLHPSLLLLVATVPTSTAPASLTSAPPRRRRPAPDSASTHGRDDRAIPDASSVSHASINSEKLVHKYPGPEILSMDHAGSTTSRNFNQILDTSSCSDCETSAMTWSYCPTLQGRVLSVVMHQVKHPVPIDVLNHLFSVYGVVETIFQSLNQHGRKVLIQYQHDYMADNALRATHGWYLYSTYCQLDVRHAYPAELQILYDYSCAFLAEINTSEQKLTHEVAMPQVEAIDDLCSVIPHLKGNNSEQQPHVIQQLLAQAKAQLETISEKLRHAIVQNSRGTIWDCIEKNAASKPLPAREDINLNCHSQQAVVEPECAVGDAETEDSSNEFVQVFTGTPKQQRYEVEQHESRQAPKSFSMPKFSPERPTAGSDIEQLLNCPCKALECRTWDEEFQGDENLLCDKSVCQTATGHSISPFPWDPGPTEFPVLFTTSAGATELQGTYALKSEFTCSYETPKLLNFLVHLKKMILWPSGKLQLITPLKLFMQSLCETIPVKVTKRRHHLEFHLMNEMVPNGSEFKDRQLAYISLAKYLCSLYSNSLLKTEHCLMSCLWEFSVSCTSLRYQFGVPTCVLHQSCYFRVPSRQESHGTQFLWDPGILSLMDMLLGKTAVLNPVHSGQTPCKQLIFIGQPVDLKKFLARLLLQSSSWYSNPKTFLQVLYCYLPIVLDCIYLELVKQLVCYTSMFSSNARCTSIATTVRMRLVLCSGEITQEGRDVAVVYHAFKLQLQMRKTSQIWDPKFNGSKAAYSSKIFQKYKAMNSQLYWHEDIKCYGVALWLIHFQPP